MCRRFGMILHVAMFVVFAWCGNSGLIAQEVSVDRLPGTATLDWEDDIASRMIDGIDRFLLDQTKKSVSDRDEHWAAMPSKGLEREQWIDDQRALFARKLGLRDSRVEYRRPQVVVEVGGTPIIAQSPHFQVTQIRWPVVGDLMGEGLLLTPKGREPIGSVIAIADADVAPEAIALGTDIPEFVNPFAAELASNGFRVIVPTLLDRTMERRRNRANLTRREYIYRSAFELGRHLVGYEVQQNQSLIDWLKHDDPDLPLAVIGAHEGGRVALYTAAIDTRVDLVAVSGYFDSRQELWREPLDRNVFGLLEYFGDAELALLVAPREAYIEAATGPAVSLPSEGGGPATWGPVESIDVESEIARTHELAEKLSIAHNTRFSLSEGGKGPAFSPETLDRISVSLSGVELSNQFSADEVETEREIDFAQRQQRLVDEMDRHNQQLLVESPYVRKEFMSNLKTDDLESFAASQEIYREHFAVETIGRIELERTAPSPRSRKSYDEELWTGYEVVLDVFPDVFAYGILLVPKGIKDGEKRPVVVCQHGLEGRPQDVVSGDHRAYHDFAAKLAERGFVVFAPQNIYIFQDRFRTLQRKANPLNLSLFSVMVPQHQTIVDWLKTLDYVDEERIGFYGLSYGGKSAMRIPALVTDYCLSICSADFNEWVWKNASSRAPFSYVWTGEYEIFEFDLGSTFNYAEMAALIAPRPFMVERGHFDGVAPDETVAYEFAKVRNLYAARLGIADRCEIEWFVGPHTINGKGTFDFLHRHLEWPSPE